jgi:hypothetical protein
MEYLLLIYIDNDPDAQGAPTEEWSNYTQELVDSGSMVGGDPLQPTDTATTVRTQGGDTLTTDGPFAETKEWLAGYYKIDVDTLDEAIEWAGRIPSVKYGGSIEVRPIMPMPAEAPSSP